MRHEFTTAADQRTLAIWAGAARSGGTAWFDDLSLSDAARPDVNVLSDPGFERHFPKADRGNDPEQPALAPSVPKGTYINQWAAAQLDRILQAAEAHGIAVQLCSHGDVYWTWDATVIDSDYATANGYRTGWLDPRRLGYWQRNYRYRVARWGYSTSVLAWEVWNEHGLIDVPSDLQRFYQSLGAFVKALDPHRHLFTTSQWSQAYSPAFWATTPTDVVNYHDYITTGLDRHAPEIAGDAAAFVYTLADGLVADWPTGTTRRPFVWGEMGTLERWDVDDPRLISGRGAALTRHPFLWAGLFSAAMTSPIDWQAAPKADTTQALKAFFAGEHSVAGRLDAVRDRRSARPRQRPRHRVAGRGPGHGAGQRRSRAGARLGAPPRQHLVPGDRRTAHAAADLGLADDAAASRRPLRRRVVEHADRAHRRPSDAHAHRRGDAVIVAGATQHRHRRQGRAPAVTTVYGTV